MRKPRIIDFQQNPAVGAAEEYLYLLMEGLNKAKFDAAFLCPESAVLNSLVTRIESLGVKAHRYPIHTSNYKIILYLKSFFRRSNPDLVHFNDPCLNGIIAARLAGVPVLVMTHHTPEHNRKYNLRGRILEKIAFQYCRPYFIFTSEHDRETGMKKDKIPEDRSSVVYHGLPPERFSKKLEGLCFAVIEASAMGIPVVATAVGGMRRSVADGTTGLLIPPHNPQALANAILWMLKHPQEAKEMGLAGQKHFTELFTQDRMVKTTEGLYESLLRTVLC